MKGTIIWHCQSPGRWAWVAGKDRERSRQGHAEFWARYLLLPESPGGQRLRGVWSYAD